MQIYYLLIYLFIRTISRNCNKITWKIAESQMLNFGDKTMFLEKHYCEMSYAIYICISMTLNLLPCANVLILPLLFVLFRHLKFRQAHFSYLGKLSLWTVQTLISLLPSLDLVAQSVVCLRCKCANIFCWNNMRNCKFSLLGEIKMHFFLLAVHIIMLLPNKFWT